jgi:hypothetical protein
MPRRLALLLFLGLSPAHAEGPNLVPGSPTPTGAAAELVLAQRTYLQAAATGDPVLLLTAIRLARGITTRPATGWTQTGETSAPPIPGPERGGPPNPGSDAAFAVFLGLTSDDPDLQDLAYDLTAQVPQARKPVATVAPGGLAAGKRDSWRVPLSGSITAEIALIGGGTGPLGITVLDESGAVVCARPPSLDPSLCRFTPARNGFFAVEVTNSGDEWISYKLIGN